MHDTTEEINEENRQIVNQFLIDNWFSTNMIIRGKIVDGTKLCGFLLKEKNNIIALVTYLISRKTCEIISLNSKKENVGIGSALLCKTEQTAISNNCTKIRLITTNDNIKALEFYQKRGYHLTKIYTNAMEKVRKLKKDVPLVGMNNIPLRDEIELEKSLI